MRLHIRADAIPRTTTRAEWKEIDRWRRKTEKQFAEHERKMREALARSYIGGAPSCLTNKMADRIINPPLLIYPPE